jgi:hypothetical protein
MALPKGWWKGKRCSRCFKRFKDEDDVKIGYRLGYGFYICAKCEKNFYGWRYRNAKR